jgi:hypothetical protein
MALFYNATPVVAGRRLGSLSTKGLRLSCAANVCLLGRGGGLFTNVVGGVFCELPPYGVPRSSLPASNAQTTPKIAHLSDTPAPIREYGTDKGTP